MSGPFPYPKSFPTKEETEFLTMALASDEEFPALWKKWKEATDWMEIDHATSRLLSFLYPRLQALGIRDDFYERVKGVHKSTWVKNQLFLRATKEIADICHAEKIPLLILKGIPLISDVYKDVGARPLGDADILVHPEDGRRLTDLLIARGWKFAKEWSAERHNPAPSVYQITKATDLQNEQGIGVDVHYNLFAADHGVGLLDVFLLKGLPSLSFPERFWKHAVPTELAGVPCLRLSNEDTLIHLIVHGSEGNTFRAFRWVLDVVLVLERLPIDWDMVLARAQEFGYAIDLRIAFAYLVEHFDVKIPQPFLDALNALPVSNATAKKYYAVADIEHSKRFRFLGNIPLLWYAYWKYEPRGFFLVRFFGFPKYLLRSWGLSNYAQLPGFVTRHYRRKIEDRDPRFFAQIQRAAHDSAYVVGGKALSFLASFAVITVMARLVPREVIGSYNYLIAVLAVVGITTLPGMNEALTRAIGRGYDGSVRSMMKRRLLFGMGGSVLAVVIGAFTWLSGNPELGIAFFIAAPFVPITDTFSTFAINFWQGKKRFDRGAIVGASYYIGLAVLSILVLVFSQDLLVIVTGIMVAQALIGFLVYQSIGTHTGETDRESEKLGVHLTIMQACAILANNADKIILWALAGPAMLAVYTFAATPISKVYQMLPISALALPYLSGSTFTKERKKDILIKMLWLFCLTIPGTIIAILIAPAFYHLFFPLYPESILIFQLLFVSVAFVPLNLLRSALVAFHQTRALYVTDVGIPVVKIILMAVLMIPFGIYGLIASLWIMSLVNCAVMLALFLQAKTVA